MKKWFVIILLTVLLLGCDRDEAGVATAVSPTTTAAAITATSTVPRAAVITEGILISELLAGQPGANNTEFIELYNAGETAVDLAGWSLWYQTREDQTEALVYTWEERSDIPGKGHYLLVHEGADFGLIADATYQTALFEGKGGLLLQNAQGDVVDRLGWGEAPAGFVQGRPFSAFEKGQSLERLPGGDLGNGSNQANNEADFRAQTVPNPQNSGSSMTPLPDKRLILTLAYPDDIVPGAAFDLQLQVENQSDEAVSEGLASVPLPDYFTVEKLGVGLALVDGRLIWQIPAVAAAETVTENVSLTAPWANVDTLFSGYYVEAAALPRTYGPLQIMSMDGSPIPIALVRSLPQGSNVSLEGIVTMYPGGFFAGSSSAKFYVEDETGGVQIFADGGAFDLSVAVGDRVKVSGQTLVFRDSLEVVPHNNMTDIEVLEKGAVQPRATAVTIPQQESDEALLGRLNQLSGTVSRIEEFAFSYEIDLVDEAGQKTLVFIEKDTGISAESLLVGQPYQVTGISELASGVRQLKPRFQSDIVQIFAPVLLVEMTAANNVLPGDLLTATVTVYNHTDAPLNNVQVTAVLPANVTLASGAGGQAAWLIEELAGAGGSATFTYSVRVDPEAAGIVTLPGATAVADQWLETAVAQATQTFVGQGVPIWAIQGAGVRSPYVGDSVRTVGVVTAVFPQLDGFWLQTIEPDNNPATSDAVFIATENLGSQVQVGDLLEIQGRVREMAGQTAVHPSKPSDIVLREAGLNGAVTAVIYDPPADVAAAALYNESLEGMLVTIPGEATVVAPTTRYGEYAVVYDKWGVDHVPREEPKGYVMFVDDGTFLAHDDQTTLPYVVASGDAVAAVTGPLAFTFDYFKVEPILPPTITSRAQPLPILPEAAANQLTIATFNVENLFDTQIPHPASPPRPSAAEYQQKLNKIAESIVALGLPTIIALQEVENIGVLQELVALPQLQAVGYEPYLVEGNDSRGIDVAFLVRGERATVQSVAAYDAPNALFSRPPLVLTATVHLESGDQQLIVLNNHFLSLAGGELQTEQVRANQAAWNVQLVERLQAENPAAHFVVLGDLNSFVDTPPLQNLEAAGLTHVYDFAALAGARPYTYIFEGATQSLDHMLVSADLFERVVGVTAVHFNADFPIPDPADASPKRTSDHDPLLVVFE